MRLVIDPTLKPLQKSRKDYTDKLGRTFHWNGTKYEYVRKGKSKSVHSTQTTKPKNRLNLDTNKARDEKPTRNTTETTNVGRKALKEKIEWAEGYLADLGKKLPKNGKATKAYNIAKQYLENAKTQYKQFVKNAKDLKTDQEPK